MVTWNSLTDLLHSHVPHLLIHVWSVQKQQQQQPTTTISTSKSSSLLNDQNWQQPVTNNSEVRTATKYEIINKNLWFKICFLTYNHCKRLNIFSDLSNSEKVSSVHSLLCFKCDSYFYYILCEKQWRPTDLLNDLLVNSQVAMRILCRSWNFHCFYLVLVWRVLPTRIGKTHLGLVFGHSSWAKQQEEIVG